MTALPDGVHVFPVRHHSPRSSAVLEAYLEAVRPTTVLVEGPEDAAELIEVLVDSETVPPVAILAYRTGGVPGSAMWPFASYSPEYVALSWAIRNGAAAGFIDIPAAVALAAGDEGEEPAEQGGEATDPSLYELCAHRSGYRSFEEFWEASFEAPEYRQEPFRRALLAYAELVRAEGPRPIDAARDAWMVRRIGERVEAGADPRRLAVVVGAAHAAAFVAGDVAADAAGLLPEPVEAAVTVIPYSYPRLSEQLGYGAGNRAPMYYQRAHDAGCDYRRATLEVLVEFTDHLRLRGFAVSLADTLEAYRLAVTLAGMRGKSEPGLDEVREATVATLCRGEAAHVDSFLWSSVVGRRVGRVAARVGRNSLQEEFWSEVKARKLPAADEPERFILQLTNEIEIGTSIFLHRLRIGGVPYASFLGTRGAAAATAADGEEAGGVAALSRVREVWEAQWTPATDAKLVERIVFGETLEQVATRLLGERLTVAGSTGEAADVLLEAVVGGCGGLLAAALAACDRFAADDSDLPSLAQAVRALAGLTAYGTSRQLAELGDDAIEALLQKTYDRAVLRVADAATGDDEAIQPVLGGLRTLHEVAVAQPRLEERSWFRAARAVVHSWAVNAAAAGLCCGLLFLAREIDDAEVAELLRQRLSGLYEPDKVARFLEGFLAVNALVLVKSPPVVEALDDYLAALDGQEFRDVLPVLRRAFAVLGATERRYLIENLVRHRGLADRAAEARAVLDAEDKARLEEMAVDLDDALDDLDGLL